MSLNSSTFSSFNPAKVEKWLRGTVEERPEEERRRRKKKRVLHSFVYQKFLPNFKHLLDFIQIVVL